jgi:catechol 2,3-dioxygenase-like lactoylglutathione lyase family enzyme
MPLPDTAMRAGQLTWLERAKLKLVGIGVKRFFAAKRRAYRFKSGPKLNHVDHITMPCGDLRIAEDFYVGVLGAKVMMRIDEAMLERIGWFDTQIKNARAAHLSLTLQSGPRIDLFHYPEGAPRRNADMHPHIALMASPRDFVGWKQNLERQGVVTTEIMRPGPPGQASFYFNDPFGNHIEIITLGFVERALAPGVPNRADLDYKWGGLPRPH